MPLEHESTLLLVDDLPENLLALDALVRGEGRTVYQAASADAGRGYQTLNLTDVKLDQDSCSGSH